MADEPPKPGSVEIVLHPGPGFNATIEGAHELPYLVVSGPYVALMVMPLGPDLTDADTDGADAIAAVTAEYAARLHRQKARKNHDAHVHPQDSAVR